MKMQTLTSMLFVGNKKKNRPGLVVIGLMFRRSWVRIPEPYTGWTFLIYICFKNCYGCLKRRKIKKKGPGMAQFKKEAGNDPFKK